MNKRIICAIISLCICISLIGCAPKKIDIFTEDATNSPSVSHKPPNHNNKDNDENGSEEVSTSNTEADKFENAFVKTEENPLSEVSLSTSKASYWYFRTLVNRGYTFEQLQKCSYGFKIEEFLNYFDFEVDGSDGALFKVGQTLFDCPWNSDTKLYSVTVRTREAELDAPNNFVFCIDVSESMAREDVLPLFKSIFSSFVSSLDEYDTVSIVICPGEPEVVLDGCQGDESAKILAAIDRVEISSGTNSSIDLEMAYAVAEEHFIDGGNNQVIIVSDGDISSRHSSFVEEKAEDGILTSVLGLGYSNYKNEKLESFAIAGQGRYYYIDCESQGERIMGEEIFKRVVCEFESVIAKLEFDSKYISEYRLIGYTQQSAGEGEPTDPAANSGVYAGDVMTLCYELRFADGYVPEDEKFASIKIEGIHIENGSKIMRPVSALTDIYAYESDDDMIFMSALIEAVMVFQKSEYIGNLTLKDILLDLQGLDFEEHPERAEFVDLLENIAYPENDK